MDKTLRIQELNDRLRTTFNGGRISVTSGVLSLGEEQTIAILKQVREFNVFNEDNDPHKEHDFGSFVFERTKIFWKIDYYDKKLEFGSEDPADETVTIRVLTVMLADEY